MTIPRKRTRRGALRATFHHAGTVHLRSVLVGQGVGCRGAASRRKARLFSSLVPNAGASGVLACRRRTRRSPSAAARPAASWRPSGAMSAGVGDGVASPTTATSCQPAAGTWVAARSRDCAGHFSASSRSRRRSRCPAARRPGASADGARRRSRRARRRARSPALRPGCSAGCGAATKRARRGAEQRLQVALDVVEVDQPLGDAPLQRLGRAEGQRRELERLAHAGDRGRAGGCGGVAQEHLAELEDAHARGLARG